jgi:hypothetical protein
MMHKYLLIAGLSLALSGASAVAQTATTPGTPSPNDPTYQSAPAPDNQQYPTDRDSSTDQHRRDREQGTYRTDQDRHDQSSGDMRRDRDSQRDDLPQSDRDYPQVQQQTDRDRQDRNDNDHSERSDRSYGDRDRQGTSEDYRNQIQSALSQANLNNVMVNDTGSRIELNGTVEGGRERRQAVNIAQQYANGRRVVDHIKVRGEGHDQDDRDRQDH